MTDIVVHCLLQWLASGSYLDICISVRISKASSYTCVHKCIDSILSCETLGYHFPTTAYDIEEATDDFKDQSLEGVSDGCVGCLDGLVLQIQTLLTGKVGNVKAFFLRHYRAYGVNVQAVCDSKCCFTYVAVAAPGGMSNIVAYHKTSLSSLVERLPMGKYIVADIAYICTKHVLTPFPGEQKKELWKDAYTFYLSQLQICIEMTFGCLVNKWGVFKRHLQVNLKNVGKVFMCAGRLHNFCINKAGIENGRSNIVTKPAENTMTAPCDVIPIPIGNNSVTREIVMDEIANLGLLSPSYNLVLNGL